METIKNFEVYKSSAGSGKTFTLASAYLSLVLKSEDPKYFRKILALTFTVKAASEMKERIISYLSAFAGRQSERKDIASMMAVVSSNTGLSDDQIINRSNNVLIHLIHDYGEFSVLTIDKFVNRIIRSFSADLGLNSDFEIEIDQTKIIEQVIDGLMNQIGINQIITELILEFVKHQIDDQKSSDISSQLASLAREVLSEEYYLNSKGQTTMDPKLIHPLQQRILNELKAIEANVSNLGRRALDLFDKFGLEEGDFYYSSRGIAKYFQKAREADLEYVSNPNTIVIKTIESDKWQSKTKEPAVLEIKDQLTELFNALTLLKPEIERVIFLKKIRTFLYSIGLIGEIIQLFDSIRESENIQLLSDYYKILSDKFGQEQSPFIYERLGQRYAHILIDEFQDTSALQWKNLLPLITNSLSEGNKSLIVGDAKQSIYRFRGSDPEQFINLPYAGYESDLLLKAAYQEFYLDTNFRSYSNVIDFNNRFFSTLHKSFLSEEHEPTFYQLHQKKNARIGGEVFFHTVERLEEMDRIESFLVPMEKRIKILLEESKCTEKDICILFQKNSDASFVAGKLLECGYKVTSSESLLLANNPNIQLLISTLIAVQNNGDPFYLQQWLSRLNQTNKLRSDYHETASWIKKAKPRMHELIKKLELNLSIDRTKLDSFNALLYLAKFFELNLNDLFVRKLLDFSLEFETTSMYLKSTFLDKWESEKSKLCIDPSGDANAINIMTIHKSKGLEFPVVFVYLPRIRN